MTMVMTHQCAYDRTAAKLVASLGFLHRCSAALGYITNIDLVLGQGRITGQALLKDIGRSALHASIRLSCRVKTNVPL